MNAHHTVRPPMARWPALALLALLAMLAVGTAQAADKTAPLNAHQRYQRETAACMRLGPVAGQADCLSEASTRLAQTLPTPPGEAKVALAENALKRCAPLPDALRGDCELRMHGAGTVSGSVEGGGLYRELVTRFIDTDAPTKSTTTTTP